MNYENVKIEKNFYNLNKQSFTQMLETLDPSENYIGTNLEKLDAFQRQLKRFNIKINGIDCDCVNKFFENSQSATLFPEFLSRAVKHGIESNNVLKHIVATTTKINTLTYHNILIDSSSSSDFEMNVVKKENNLPETKIKTNETTIALSKCGRMLTTSYETIEFEKINSFVVALKQIGRCLCNSIVKNAIKILIEGNDEKTASEVVNVNQKNEISYSDLINMWSKFQTYDLNTILVHPNVFLKIVQLKEFNQPLTNLNFAETGVFSTPFGAKIVQTNLAPIDKIIFLDKNFALNQIIAKPITVEADKLIDKQIERTSIFTITGFAKIFKDACYVLNLSQ